MEAVLWNLSVAVFLANDKRYVFVLWGSSSEPQCPASHLVVVWSAWLRFHGIYKVIVSKYVGGKQRCKPCMPVLGHQMQDDHYEVEGSLVYIEGSRLARATQ